MPPVDSGRREGLSASRPGPVRIGRHLYVRAPNPIHFPSEEPLEEAVSETKPHLEARTTLYLSVKDAIAADHAIGCGQLLYWDAADPQRRLSPDLFVKRGRADWLFDNWKVWEHAAPDLALEIMSPIDPRDLDWNEKMARYRASGIGEVVRFDPRGRMQPVRIWDRIEGDLVERALDGPDLMECAALGLWWVVLPSGFGPQIRLARDQEGKDLLLTPSEDLHRLTAELAKARAARALAEQERQLAERALQQELEAQAVAERDRDAAERGRDAALAELAALRAQVAVKSDRGT